MLFVIRIYREKFLVTESLQESWVDHHFKMTKKSKKCQNYLDKLSAAIKNYFLDRTCKTSALKNRNNATDTYIINNASIVEVSDPHQLYGAHLNLF